MPCRCPFLIDVQPLSRLLPRLALCTVLLLVGCKPRNTTSEVKDADKPVPPSPDLVPNDLDDLPAVGRSLFDQIYHGERTFPRKLEDVITLLEMRYGAEVEGLLIPHGRSLQRHATDAKAPRAVLLVTKLKLAGDCVSTHDDRLYIGFAERPDSLEIISFNDRAGRFEFQLVKDFSKPSAKLLYAPRALCTSCHQGGTPIFSFPPWQETNGPSEQGDVVPEFVTEEIQKFHPGAQTLYGVPVSNEKASAGSFDRHVQSSSELVGLENLWTKGCGGGEGGYECRRALVGLALAASVGGGCKLSSLKTDAAVAVRAHAATQNVWPAGGVALPNRNLEDRKPEPVTKFMRAEEDPLTRRAPFVVVKASVEPKGEFDSSTFCILVSKFAGGTSPLLLASFLKGDGGHFLGKDEVAAVKAALAGAGPDWEKRLDDPAAAPLFDAAPLSRERYLATILRAFGKTAEADKAQACIRGSGTLPAPELARSKAAKAGGTVVGLFRSYCEGCHTGHGESRLDFMEPDDDEAVWKALRANPNVLARLEARTMPPPPQMRSVEEELDRELMIMKLKSGELR